MTSIKTAVLIKCMNIVDTKERILDAAEYLFAHHGFHTTSLREITGRAGVNVAAVNYHFGSKEALLKTVFERRLVPLNEARLKMLGVVTEKAKREGRRPGAGDIMRALIEPTVRFSASGEGAKNFIILVSRSIFAPNDILKKNFFRLMGPFLRTMLESLKEALPGLPENILIQRYHFSVGALAHTMRVCNDETIPKELRMTGAADPGPLIEELVKFITAGMETL